MMVRDFSWPLSTTLSNAPQTALFAERRDRNSFTGPLEQAEQDNRADPVLSMGRFRE
jgi:hypothetical protein